MVPKFGTKDLAVGQGLLSFAMQLENGDFALEGLHAQVFREIKTSRFGGSSDCWVLRVDENGSKLWDYTYGGEDWDVSNQMGFYLMGIG